MPKFRLHPLFITVCIFSVLTGGILPLVSSLTVLALHEWAHYIKAKSYGFIPEGIFLTPFGACMSFDCGLGNREEFFVTLYGPLSNIIACVIISAIWWFIPSFYVISKTLFWANFALAAFNLLPVFPFDGGRLLLSLSKNKLRFLKNNRIVGFFIAVLFLVLGVFCAIKFGGFAIIFASFVILWNNIFEAPKERYRVIFADMGIYNPPYSPVVTVEIRIDERCRLSALLNEIKRPGRAYKVYVKSDKKEVLLSQENLEKLFRCNRRQTVGEVIRTTLPYMQTS